MNNAEISIEEVLSSDKQPTSIIMDCDIFEDHHLKSMDSYGIDDLSANNLDNISTNGEIQAFDSEGLLNQFESYCNTNTLQCIDNNKLTVTKPDINAVVMFEQPRAVSLLQKRENCKTKCIIPKRAKREVIVKKANYKILKDALSKNSLPYQDTVCETDSYFGDHNYSLPPWKDSNLLFLWGNNQDDNVNYIDSYKDNKEAITMEDDNIENMHNMDTSILFDQRLSYIENNDFEESSDIVDNSLVDSKERLRELISQCNSTNINESMQHYDKDNNSVSDKKHNKIIKEENIKSDKTAEDFIKELSKENLVRKIPKKIKRATSADTIIETNEQVERNNNSDSSNNASNKDAIRNIKLKLNKKRKSSTDLNIPKRKPIKKRRESIHRFKSFEEKKHETTRVRRISKSEEKTLDSKTFYNHNKKLISKRESKNVSKDEFLAKIMARWKKESVKSNTPVDMEICSDKEEEEKDEKECEEVSTDEPIGEITTHVDGTPIVDGLSGCLKTAKPKLVVFKDIEPSKKNTKKKALTWEQYRAKKQKSGSQVENNNGEDDKKSGGSRLETEVKEEQAASLDSDLEPGEIICDITSSMNEDVNMDKVEKVIDNDKTESNISNDDKTRISLGENEDEATDEVESLVRCYDRLQESETSTTNEDASNKQAHNNSGSVFNKVEISFIDKKSSEKKHSSLIFSKRDSSPISTDLHNKLPAYHSDFSNSTKFDEDDLNDSYSFSRSCSSESESSYSSSSDSSSEDERDRERRYRRRRKSSYSFSSGSSGSWSRSRSQSPDIDKWQSSVQEERRRKKQDQIEQRRIVYVGRLPDSITKRILRENFEQFGKIECCSLHMRECGDNYGFVTFVSKEDAFTAIERGNQCKGMEKYDLCFGGRRQFCGSQYADLDGDKEEEEELATGVPEYRGPVSAESEFDALLQQALARTRRK
ncbi:DgyrCDS2202 [Dimorphilus gyrociliatus]|uniref:DgyrCDS2202 n=1 Tax=Dimorphilus gyrociliatus TaxID=2664684 RepID=A0A7I8V9R3_9ANNE|nr:DgyrCDS2202 [Dimorphilus gyrociliatus]